MNVLKKFPDLCKKLEKHPFRSAQIQNQWRSTIGRAQNSYRRTEGRLESGTNIERQTLV